MAVEKEQQLPRTQLSKGRAGAAHGAHLSLTWQVPTGNIPEKAGKRDMLCPGGAPGRSSGTNLSAGSLIPRKWLWGMQVLVGKAKSQAVVSGAGPSQVTLWPSSRPRAGRSLMDRDLPGHGGISPTLNRAMATLPGRILVFFWGLELPMSQQWCWGPLPVRGEQPGICCSRGWGQLSSHKTSPSSPQLLSEAKPHFQGRGILWLVLLKHEHYQSLK